ncbi:MAG: radical SAM family heme chaperone HemW [Acidimicrobiales bacterium]|nr:radical SAM family heme chaperone HemW [Acidimicrobiales bacterium]
MAPTEPFGVYVHVPFCTSRCDYCAFATWTDRFHLVNDYLDACVIDAARSLDGAPLATSVFFGGGTPSLLEPDQLAKVLAAVRHADGAEVTVECNPETVDATKLAGYRAAGVTRLSFGVQSMVPAVLASLGRHHDPAAVASAVDAAGRAGFDGEQLGYNVDLIFGAAGESPADWEETLLAVLALDPPPHHVSGYGLTVEPGTPLAHEPDRHPDPDDQADKYLLADQMLSAAGLSWYEISNWARPGAECRHNQLYWDQGEYIGIGCSAHSHRVDAESGSARRWWNVRTPDRYIRLAKSGQRPSAAGEDINPQARLVESLQLALRTRAGVPESSLPGWDEDPVLPELVTPAGSGRLVLTTNGRLLANEVAIRLVPAPCDSVENEVENLRLSS